MTNSTDIQERETIARIEKLIEWFVERHNYHYGLSPDGDVSSPEEDHAHEAILTLRAILALRSNPQPGEVERLREALEPFAARIVDVGETETDEDTFSNSRTPYSRSPVITVGDIRRARAALTPSESGEAVSPTPDQPKQEVKDV